MQLVGLGIENRPTRDCKFFSLFCLSKKWNKRLSDIYTANLQIPLDLLFRESDVTAIIQTLLPNILFHKLQNFGLN